MDVAPHVAELRELLGLDVLLLAWPLGKKGGKRRWGHLNVDSMNDPRYLAKLGRGNIGVALGQKSGGLCSLDIDSDSNMREFIARNGEIANTLQSRGSRGCNLWWRVAEPYPPLTPLKLNGSGWGEWRSTGAQTIIYGKHPDGHAYRITNRVQPVPIEFVQIRWPEGIFELLQGGSIQSDTERTELPELTEPSENPEPTEADRRGKVSTGVSAITSVDEAVRVSLPTKIHDNHHCLFTLARAIKALELVQGKLSITEKRTIFSKWHLQAGPFLRTGESVDDYWFEFLEGYENAEHPLGVDIVAHAWNIAVDKEPPPEAEQFSTREIRLLVTLCRELQILCADRPFFLSSRTVQRLFGQETHATAARWLRGLCRSGILKVVIQGGPKTQQATRFRYQLPIS